jgi:putative transposase
MGSIVPSALCENVGKPSVLYEAFPNTCGNPRSLRISIRCGIFHNASRPPKKCRSRIVYKRRLGLGPMFGMAVFWGEHQSCALLGRRNGMRKDRRKFEAAFKMQLVQQIEAGALTRMQAARTHQLSPSLIDRWRKQFREDKLVDRPSNRERQLEAENEKLKSKIGDLVMQNDQLKKLQDYAQRLRNANTSVITAKNLDQFRKGSK